MKDPRFDVSRQNIDSALFVFRLEVATPSSQHPSPLASRHIKKEDGRKPPPDVGGVFLTYVGNRTILFVLRSDATP